MTMTLLKSELLKNGWKEVTSFGGTFLISPSDNFCISEDNDTISIGVFIDSDIDGVVTRHYYKFEEVETMEDIVDYITIAELKQ